MRLKSFLTFALISVFLLLPALGADKEGEEPKKEDKLFNADLDGYYRLRWTGINEIDAYPAGPIPGDNKYWDQRWRLAPSVTLKPGYRFLEKVSAHMIVDLWDGQFGIDEERTNNLRFDERTWEQQYLGEDADWKEEGLWFRNYWVEANLGVAEIRIGRMTSDWGRGILANSSTGFDDDFGDNYFGDIVDRVMVATRPIDLVTGGSVKTDIYLAYGYDWQVVQDSTGDENDNPTQYLIALFKEPEKDTGDLLHDLMVGIYYVHREQDDSTEVNVIDLTFRMPIFLFDDALKLVSSAEFVHIFGKTKANQSLNAPKGSDVEMYGFVGTLAAETKRFDVIAEVGYASGDMDPFDDHINNMSFNPDYNVGLLMFERVIAAASSNSSAMFNRKALSNEAPAGIELLPTNGSVTNAFYLYPRLKVRPFKNLECLMGLLYAKAPADLVDPYQTFLNGGVATNYNGGKADDNLGWELDLGVNYTVGDAEKLALRFGAQWGLFWPGDAFDDASGDSMDKVSLGQFRFDVIY